MSSVLTQTKTDSGSKIGVELMDPNKLVDSLHTDGKT